MGSGTGTFVDADLGDDHPSGDRPDTRNLIQPGGRLSERGDQVLDAIFQGVSA